MTATTSMGSTPAISQQPAPLKKSADLMVLVVTIAALIVAWQIRGSVVNATMQVEAAGVSLSVPANSITLQGTADFGAWRAPDGLIVRINVLEHNGIPGTETLARLNERKANGVNYTMMPKEKVDRWGGKHDCIEYAYVHSTVTNNATSLQVMRGYEVLVVRGAEMFVVSLEAEQDKFYQVEEFWPRLLDSVKIPEAKQ
jgi:hypothetical protein